MRCHNRDVFNRWVAFTRFTSSFLPQLRQRTEGEPDREGRCWNTRALTGNPACRRKNGHPPYLRR